MKPAGQGGINGLPAGTTPVSHPDWLVCPDCKRPLQCAGEKLQCPGCQSAWPLVNGVPHFVEDFPYWGEISREECREVNQRAASGNWKAALLDSPVASVQAAAGMILNLDRANWQLLVSLPPKSRVLDIGAGMGTNSHALALHYEDVIALEPVLERVEFMRHRFAQEHLGNISVVRSSIWTLPFPPESFDFIVMNGVLEWVPQGREEDPGDLQKLALRNVQRLLRPGGYLYVGIENRLAAGYFIGYPDPHCGLPLVTILPRPLVHWYARKKGQNGYRNYLYSSRGYQKLLQRAGFRQADIYLALPSYNHPRFLMPLKNNIFSHYSRNFGAAQGHGPRNILRKLLLRLGLLKYFEYSFAIIASK